MNHEDTTSTLERLLTAARSDHNETAFNPLYEFVVDDVFTYVRTRTPTREDALDVTQSVMVDLWSSLPKFTYHTDAQFYGFIFTIAKRRLAKLYRSSRKDSRKRESDYHEPIATISIESMDAVEISHTALATLKRIDRDIIVLHYWLHRSFREIGDIIGISEQNARIRHHRALAKLKNALSYAN